MFHVCFLCGLHLYSAYFPLAVQCVSYVCPICIYIYAKYVPSVWCVCPPYFPVLPKASSIFIGVSWISRVHAFLLDTHVSPVCFPCAAYDHNHACFQQEFGPHVLHDESCLLDTKWRQVSLLQSLVQNMKLVIFPSEPYNLSRC